MRSIPRNSFRLVAALSLALVVLAGVPGNGAAAAEAGGLEEHLSAGSAATHPAHVSNGTIAFVAYNGAAHLDVTNPDGSGFRQLVLCYRRGTICSLTSLAWSPDGRRLAFLKAISPMNCVRCYRSPRPPNESLNVINADGSGARRLATCVRCFDEPDPALSWSPDGSEIVFSRGGALDIVDVASDRTVRLTTCHGPDPLLDAFKAGCSDWDPAWSPDGSRIVFSRNRSSLEIIRANGSGMRRLVYLPGQDPGRTSWSPDGPRIAFVAGTRVYEVTADGSRRSRLFSAPRVGSLLVLDFGESGPDGPYWSPDGSHIVIYDQPVVRRTPKGLPERITDVWVLSANGSHQRRLFHTPCCDSDVGAAAWSPDGTHIVFSLGGISVAGRPYDYGGIYLMDADGRHLHRLVGDETTPQYLPLIETPTWQPIP